MSSENLVIASILVPLFAAPLIALSGSKPNLREGITIATSIIVFIIVAAIYTRFKSGEEISLNVIELFPGLSIAFKLEALGVLFSLVASFLWIITSLYGIAYMRGNKERNQTRFFMLFPIAISAALGIAFAGNLLTLFIFYEVMTLSTFPLVTHKGTEDAVKSGRIYLGVLISSSIGLFLPAIIWVWTLTGTTDFTAGGILFDKLDGPLLTVLAVMFLLGIGKAAVMPVHRWLPAAMVAPTPVSALLHAVAVVKAGVFSVLKIMVYTFGVDHLHDAPWVEILLGLACFTVLISSVVAFLQDNLKKRLAYSTISQLSYIVLAAVLLAPISTIGAALHIAAHAFGKITLFFAAGSVYTASKKTEISQLNGIGWRMPWTMGAFCIGGLSMIGVPPAFGFISKWYMLMGAFQAEHATVIAAITVSTLLNAGYFIPIMYRAFFLKEEPGQKEHGESPRLMVFALTVTAALTIGFFFFPGVWFGLAQSIQTN